MRTGAIASFPNLTALSRGFGKVASMIPLFDPNGFWQRHGANSQLPNVINIALVSLRNKMTCRKVLGAELPGCLTSGLRNFH